MTDRRLVSLLLLYVINNNNITYPTVSSQSDEWQLLGCEFAQLIGGRSALTTASYVNTLNG